MYEKDIIPVLNSGLDIGAFRSIKSLLDKVELLKSTTISTVFPFISIEPVQYPVIVCEFAHPLSNTLITKIIIKNGKHLLKIINDILDISKIEANKMEFEKTYFSPVALVMEVKDLVESQFLEKNIKFYIEYEYPFPNVIYNDALRIKQIILNLCSNALKFTKVGKVSIKIHCEIENEKLFFTVIDSGIGLSIEQKEKIFDAFAQADTSTTRKYGGTGLGLSLSKQFAEKMGG